MPQCPICNTEYQEEPELSCSACGWDLTLLPMTFSEIPVDYLSKLKKNLSWAKKIWEKSQSQASLTEQQLENINQEKKQLIQCNTELNELHINDEQKISSLKLENESHEKEIQNYQEQIKNYQVKINDEQVKLNIAKNTLSIWLDSDLLESFVSKLLSIRAKDKALSEIKELQLKLNEQWNRYPVRLEILRFTIEFLEDNLNQPHEENLQLIVDKYDSIVLVDGILAVEAELKYRHIIQFDSGGQLLL